MEVVAILVGAAQFPDEFGPAVQMIVLSKGPTFEGPMNGSARDPHQDHRVVWRPGAPVLKAVLEGAPEGQPEDGLVLSTSLIGGQQFNMRMPVRGVPAPRSQQHVAPNGAYAHQRIDPVEIVVWLPVLYVLDVAPELGFGIGLHVAASMISRATQAGQRLLFQSLRAIFKPNESKSSRTGMDASWAQRLEEQSAACSVGASSSRN